VVLGVAVTPTVTIEVTTRYVIGYVFFKWALAEYKLSHPSFDNLFPICIKIFED
jgi:hypothetical protein